jgi:GlpG protein
LKPIRLNSLFILFSLAISLISAFGSLLYVIEPLSFLSFEISETFSKYLSFYSLNETYFINNEWWRLITPIFIHFSLIHLVFNCLWVYVLGQQIEIQDGKLLFLILMIVSGVSGNFAQYLDSGPSLFGGLSGCVYGMFGYTLIIELQTNRNKYGLPPAIYIFMIAWLILGFLGILNLFGFGNIANFAHLGGLISGLVMAMVVIAFKKIMYLNINHEKN